MKKDQLGSRTSQQTGSATRETTGAALQSKGESVPLFQDDWWLEHLEEELEPNLREDLELLVKNSRADRNILESLKTTRRLLKESDEVPMPESGLFYESLHAKIMSSLDDDILDDPKPKGYAPKRGFAFAKLLVPMAMTMAVALVSWSVIRSAPDSETATDVGAIEDSHSAEAGQGEERFERKLAMVSAQDRADFSNTVLGFESESDLIASAAAEKLESLSSAEAEALYAMLKN